MKDVSPQLVADVTLYSTENGGRKGPTASEWFGCPIMVTKDNLNAWDCRILLNGTPLWPGDTRRVGIVFLSPDQAVPIVRAAGKFYLWDGHFIGKGTVV